MPAPDLRAALTAALPAERLARLRQVQTLAAELGLATYLVGGLVRDLVLGRKPGDFDFVVVPATPGERDPAGPRLARKLAFVHGGKVTLHAAFGTATWFDQAGASVDFATARTETYPQPGALPVVTPAFDIDADLARRDFTINALALRVDGDNWGELSDPFYGLEDINVRLVRVLHPASFQDDPTRLFRAIRYAHRLGFEIESGTAALIPPALAIIPALSGERLRHEFDLIFAEPAAPAMLVHLHALGALAAAHPALRWSDDESKRAGVLAALPRPEWRLGPGPHVPAAYLALLLSADPPEASAALARLSVSRDLADAVSAALAYQPASVPASVRPSEIVAALDALTESALLAVYALHPALRPVLERYLAEWRFVRSELSGDDLQALGLPAGPAFRGYLWQLRAGRLDGTLTDRAAELALARQWLKPEVR